MLFKPFFYEPAKHVYWLLRDPEYVKWCIQDAKLGHIRRFRECKTRVHGWDILIPDSASFLSAYKEIFVSRIYQFNFPSSPPRILDLGANIGLSVLYFKRLFPEAKITAFEADPIIFEYLEKNVYGNGFKDVELINKAIWHEKTILKFHAEGADGGHISDAIDEKGIEIETVNIDEFLEGKQFDFIKMDIEGAEDTVFPACKGHLSDVKYVFVEYHSRIGQEQKLADIIGLMTEQGYRIDVHSIVNSKRPYVQKTSSSGFDLQLNIFAWKE